MSSLDLTITGVSNGGGGSSTWALGANFPCSTSPEPDGTASGTLTVSFSVGSGSIPAGATITGWSCSITKDAASGGNIWDVTVSAKAGTKGLSSHANTGTPWTNTPSETDGYGTGTTDLWGDTAPTPTAVNGSGGEVDIAVKTDGTASTAYVRSVGLTVYYSLPATAVLPPHAAVGPISNRLVLSGN